MKTFTPKHALVRLEKSKDNASMQPQKPDRMYQPNSKKQGRLLIRNKAT